MGEIGTWKRKPADLHGIKAGWSCVTGQSSSNLLSDSKVEGICASVFKCLQEILATLFDAGYSYKSNYQKYQWLLRTLYTVLPAFLACWMDCWHSFCLGLTERAGKRCRQCIGTARVVSKSRRRECPIRVTLPRQVPCSAPAHMLNGCSKIKRYRWKEACCPRCLSGPARQVLSADVFLLGNSPLWFKISWQILCSDGLGTFIQSVIAVQLWEASTISGEGLAKCLGRSMSSHDICC